MVVRGVVGNHLEERLLDQAQAQAPCPFVWSFALDTPMYDIRCVCLTPCKFIILGDQIIP